MLMYKNIICFFSFSFITQKIWTGKDKRESKTAKLAQKRVDRIDLPWNL